METKIPSFLFKEFEEYCIDYFKKGSTDYNKIDKQILIEFTNAYTLAMFELVKIPEHTHSDLMAYALTSVCMKGKFNKDLDIETYNLLTKYFNEELKSKFKETHSRNGNSKVGVL